MFPHAMLIHDISLLLSKKYKVIYNKIRITLDVKSMLHGC